MGGLRKYMPITWITSLLGSLALIGTPLFAGFYSKDSIIEAVHASHLPGSGSRTSRSWSACFVTAFYSFRMYFLVFHGAERFRHKPFPASTTTTTSTPSTMTRTNRPGSSRPPLILLAIPSVVIGFMTIQPMLFGEFFKDSIIANLEQQPGDGGARQGVPRRRGDGAARPDGAAVLAGAGRGW